MRNILGVYFIVLAISLVGCTLEVDEDGNLEIVLDEEAIKLQDGTFTITDSPARATRREEREDKEKEEEATWDEATETSLALAEELNEDMDYDDVREHLGSRGKLKLTGSTPKGERKIYEWELDGGVRLKVTLDADLLAKWETEETPRPTPDTESGT